MNEVGSQEIPIEDRGERGKCRAGDPTTKRDSKTGRFLPVGSPEARKTHDSKAYYHQYYLDNKVRRNAYSKAYRLAHLETLRKYNAEYRIKHPRPERKLYAKQWRQSNQDKTRQYHKTYRAKPDKQQKEKEYCESYRGKYRAELNKKA